MRLIEQDPASLPTLLGCLEASRTIHGSHTKYSSLVSPSTLDLELTELDAITADLSHLAQLYRFASELYLESLRDKDLRWVRRAVETGLRPVDVTLTRRLSQSRLEPMMQRVDYADVLPGQRHIAEVQWKSGGPGYFIGHQSAFLAAFPPGPG